MEIADTLIQAKAGLVKRIFFLLPVITIFFLTSCASSYVARNVAGDVDQGVQHTKEVMSSTVQGNLAEAYQNTSQVKKGMLLGGSVGALAGVVYPGMGVLTGAAAGVILGGSYGAYIDAHTTLKDKLINRGANVIVLGDHVLIVFSSARLFNSLSPTIKPEAYSTLNLLATYLNRYTKVLVKISAYTNDVGSKQAAQNLSQQQAESISKYLNAAGLDARLLYAVGYGGTNLVDYNSAVWDGNDNYRIEISLQKEYV